MSASCEDACPNSNQTYELIGGDWAPRLLAGSFTQKNRLKRLHENARPTGHVHLLVQTVQDLGEVSFSDRDREEAGFSRLCRKPL